MLCYFASASLVDPVEWNLSRTLRGSSPSGCGGHFHPKSITLPFSAHPRRLLRSLMRLLAILQCRHRPAFVLEISSFAYLLLLHIRTSVYVSIWADLLRIEFWLTSTSPIMILLTDNTRFHIRHRTSVVIVLSLAEIACTYPTAGGQHHGVAVMAPMKSRVVASWFIAWTSIGGLDDARRLGYACCRAATSRRLFFVNDNNYAPRRWGGGCCSTTWRWCIHRSSTCSACRFWLGWIALVVRWLFCGRGTDWALVL